jgi:hypothetical protein
VMISKWHEVCSPSDWLIAPAWQFGAGVEVYVHRCDEAHASFSCGNKCSRLSKRRQQQ